MRINYVRLKIPDVMYNLNDTNPSICEETHDRISSEKPFSYLALMDNVDSLLIRKQEPWYVRTSQSVMEIRFISLNECHGLTDKFKEFFQEPKRNLNSQILLIHELHKVRITRL